MRCQHLVCIAVRQRGRGLLLTDFRGLLVTMTGEFQEAVNFGGGKNRQHRS
jgi:hypothetical protein